MRILAAALIAAALVGAAVAVTLAVTSSRDRSAAAPPTPTATSYDGSTLLACREAKEAANGNDPGSEHARAARSAAELSDVPALREIARQHGGGEYGTPLDNTRALTAAISVLTWCGAHHVPGAS